MKKIDAFAHILPPKFYQELIKLEPTLPQKFPYIENKTLLDVKQRIKDWPDENVKQVLSLVNINVEDFVAAKKAALLCEKANSELSEIVQKHSAYFQAGVGMLLLNDISASEAILEDIKKDPNLVGAQIFTRHCGKSIASPEFEPIFKKAEELSLPLWLQPVFDQRKQDNNLVFSWDYELSQAMLQLIQADLFRKYPNVKIIVHHAGAMVPFFAERIKHILPKKQAEDFKKFYVDTAILGNSAALWLTIDYFGVDHVLFATAAPFGSQPAGATREVDQAINSICLSVNNLEKVFCDNYLNFIQ